MGTFSAWLYMKDWVEQWLRSEGAFPRLLSKRSFPEGQVNEPPSKHGATPAIEAGAGRSGEETRPPGDDRRQAAKGDAEPSRGKTSVEKTMNSINGVNGSQVRTVEPYRRNWIKRLVRGGQASDRASEDDKV